MTGRGGQPDFSSSEAVGAFFGVSRETRLRLERYCDELRIWQKAVNLVAPATLPDAWHRHFADSAQLFGLLPTSARSVVDLGSGAGFPGLVLAIMGAEQGLRVTLVESDRRKSAFLAHVARQTGIAVDIIVARIESTETHDKVGTTDVVTARALASLSKLLDWGCPFFGSETLGLFLKGRDAEREVLEAQGSWSFESSLVPSVTEAEASVVSIRRPIRKTAS